MAKKSKIAFDLDGVIVDKPPLIPHWLLEWLFRGNRKKELIYRFPKNRLEQQIRKLSHYHLFRPPLERNIAFIKKIAQHKGFELYIVSGRYSFLQEETEKWLKKAKIKHLFKGVFINLNNEQPHLFKEKILKKLKVNYFVDDDPLLVDWLTTRLGETKIYCSLSGGCRRNDWENDLLPGII